VPGAIPDSIDILSIDYYAGFGNDTLPPEAEVANVSSFFTHELFPRMVPRQRAMVVPGFFGCSNQTSCGTHAQQEARLQRKLRAYIAYLETEPRLVGLAPWHLNNRTHGAPCDWELKANCHACDMRLGAEAFPRLTADWMQFGAQIVNNATANNAQTS
jgi:hypothetical protein